MREDEAAAEHLSDQPLAEMVLDKGYHSNETLVELADWEIRAYASEPDRGRRCWKDQARARDAVYANRRRIRGQHGKWLLRQRGELLERPFAHYLGRGGMRRAHLRGHENILKRLLIHVAGFNLGLVMQQILGHGTPRGLRAAQRACEMLLWIVTRCLMRVVKVSDLCRRFAATGASNQSLEKNTFPGWPWQAFATGC